MHAKHATCTRAGVRSEVLDAAALSEAEPRLRTGLAGALLVPDDAILYPPAAARYLLQAAQRAGARLIRGTVDESGQRRGDAQRWHNAGE